MANINLLIGSNSYGNCYQSLNKSTLAIDTFLTNAGVNILPRPQKVGNLAATINSKLAESGIDTATLTIMRDGFNKLEALNKVHITETGEAQGAIIDWVTAWDATENQMRIFYKRAKIALKNQPQLREKLGMLER